VGVFSAFKGNDSDTGTGILVSDFVSTVSGYTANTTVTLYNDIELTGDLTIPNFTITLQGTGDDAKRITGGSSNKKFIISNAAATLVIGNKISAEAEVDGSAGTLTVQGSGEVTTVTGSSTIVVNVKDSAKVAALKGTGTINVQGGSIIEAKLDETATLNVSGSGSITTLQLTGTTPSSNIGNSKINVEAGWGGSVGALNLYGASADEATIISYWEDHTVVTGTGKTSAINSRKIPLGKFLGTSTMATGTDISSNTNSSGGTGYRLKAADGTLKDF
jgi:hypothetical protein